MGVGPVSVVLDPGHDDELRAVSLASVEDQTLTDWEVVTDLARRRGSTSRSSTPATPGCPTGWSGSSRWRRPFVADELEGERGNGEKVVLPHAGTRTSSRPGWSPSARRCSTLGPVDPALPVGLAARPPDAHGTEVELVPSIGVRRRFPDRRRALRPPPGDWRRVVLNRHLVDWAALEARARRRPGSRRSSCRRTTTASSPPRASSRCSRPTDRPHVEVIVWDNGSSAEVAAALDRLARRPGAGPARRREPRLRARQQPRPRARHRRRRGLPQQRHHRPAGLARSAPRGAGGRRRAGRAAAAALPDAGPSSPRASRSRRAAGCRTPSSRASPSRTRTASRGCASTRSPVPRSRCATPTRWRCAASTRSSPTAWRTSTSATGSARRRDGHFRVLDAGPWSTTSPARPAATTSTWPTATVYLDRWQRVVEPRDDAALWATRGLRVVDHDIGPARHGEPPRLRIPRPVLVREARLQVTEAPRLRWAIKNAAPGRPGRRALGRHPLRRLPGRGAPRPRPGGRRRPAPRVGPPHRPPRRRRARAARPGPPRPEPRAGVAALGDLAPRAGHPRRGARLRPGPRRRRGRGPSAGPATGRCRIEPLLQATDPERFHPDAGSPGTGDAVLFVGNSRRLLRPVVRDALAAGLPLAVYGDLWSGLVPDEVVRGRSIPNDQLAAAYRSAGVVLNDHHDDMRADGFVSNRLFDAVASGARVVTDRASTRPGRAVRSLGPGLRDPRRPGPARHPPRPRRGLRRRRHPPSRRRPGPHRALLRRPRRPPRRGRPRGQGRAHVGIVRDVRPVETRFHRPNVTDYPDDRIAKERASSSGSATRSRLRSNIVDRCVGYDGEDAVPSSRPGPGCRRGSPPGTAA